jgi:hypothetical protein
MLTQFQRIQGHAVDVAMIALFFVLVILLWPSWRRFQADAEAMAYRDF